MQGKRQILGLKPHFMQCQAVIGGLRKGWITGELVWELSGQQGQWVSGRRLGEEQGLSLYSPSPQRQSL